MPNIMGQAVPMEVYPRTVRAALKLLRSAKRQGPLHFVNLPQLQKALEKCEAAIQFEKNFKASL